MCSTHIHDALLRQVAIHAYSTGNFDCMLADSINTWHHDVFRIHKNIAYTV